jgi:hypothetical protein
MAFASFIGIEVAWKVDGNHSGIAVLGGDQRRVRLKALCSLYALLAPGSYRQAQFGASGL